MTDNLPEEYSLSATRTRKPSYGSLLLPKISQKPFGICSFVGFLTGVANSLILPIPLYISVPAGIILGMTVCLVACPGMKNFLAKHKQKQLENHGQLLARKGRNNAFTMHE
jgi:hypothetical protein